MSSNNRFEIGDKVYSPIHGWGIIEDTEAIAGTNIKVNFDGFHAFYELDGRFSMHDDMPTLWHKDFAVFQGNVPKREPEKKRKYIVTATLQMKKEIEAKSHEDAATIFRNKYFWSSDFEDCLVTKLANDNLE